jgi:hypothetical protein
MAITGLLYLCFENICELMQVLLFVTVEGGVDVLHLGHVAGTVNGFFELVCFVDDARLHRGIWDHLYYCQTASVGLYIDGMPHWLKIAHASGAIHPFGHQVGVRQRSQGR